MESNIPVAQLPAEPVLEPVNEPKSPLSKWLKVFAGLCLLAILFSGVYFLGIYQGMNQKPASKTVEKAPIHTTSSPTPASNAASATANWKTFTTQSGVSFKYPSDWTPKETVTPKDSSGFGPRDGVTLTSPNGLIIVYGDHIQGLGGGCDPADCPYNHVLKVEPVNIAGYGTLNLAELVVKDGNDSSVIDAQVGLIDPKTYPNLQVGSKQQFSYYVMFNDKDPNKYLDEFNMYIYDSNSKSNKMGQLSNLNQYFTDPEVQTAETIIKTLKFTDQTSQGDESTNWKTYINTKYGFNFKYPANLEPSEVNEVGKSTIDGDPRKLLVNLNLNNATEYSTEVLDSTETGGMFITSWYGNIEGGPSSIQKSEINGQTVYKFFMAKAGINGGAGYVLFQKGTTIVALSTSVKNGNPEDILGDNALSKIATSFQFTP